MDQIVTAGTPLATSSRVATSTTSVQYAGFWRRLVATLLDSLIVSLGTSALNTLVGFTNNDTLIAIVSVVNFVLSLAYYIYFVGVKGQTLGKMVLKIKVVRATTSAPVGYGRAALREIVGKFVSSIVIGLGYLWIIWDKKKQGWHDKMSDTVVVKV